jgi:hypothetical protein
MMQPSLLHRYFHQLWFISVFTARMMSVEYSADRIQLTHNGTVEHSKFWCVRTDVEVGNVHPPRESSSQCRGTLRRLSNCRLTVEEKRT